MIIILAKLNYSHLEALSFNTDTSCVNLMSYCNPCQGVFAKATATLYEI